MMPPLSVLLSNWEPHVQCPPCYPWPGSGTLRGLVIVRGLFCPRLLQGTRLQPVPHPSSHLPMSTSKPPPPQTHKLWRKSTLALSVQHRCLSSACSQPRPPRWTHLYPRIPSPISKTPRVQREPRAAFWTRAHTGVSACHLPQAPCKPEAPDTRCPDFHPLDLKAGG